MTVDFILTPNEVIETKCTRPKPEGIIWRLLDWNKFYQVSTDRSEGYLYLIL